MTPFCLLTLSIQHSVYWGLVDYYGGGGYTQLLPDNQTQSAEIVANLKVGNGMSCGHMRRTALLTVINSNPCSKTSGWSAAHALSFWTLPCTTPTSTCFAWLGWSHRCLPWRRSPPHRYSPLFQQCCHRVSADWWRHPQLALSHSQADPLRQRLWLVQAPTHSAPRGTGGPLLAAYQPLFHPRLLCACLRDHLSDLRRILHWRGDCRGVFPAK